MTKKALFTLLLSLSCVGTSFAEPVVNTESPEFQQAVRETVRAALKKREAPPTRILAGQEIALEIAEKNPYAALIFVAFHDSFVKGRMMAEVDEATLPRFDPPLNAQTAHTLVRQYYSGEVLENELQPDRNAALVRVDHAVRKTADGAAYLTLKIYDVDAEYREIGPRLPHIRVNMQWKDDDKGGYWEPVTWQAS